MVKNMVKKIKPVVKEPDLDRKPAKLAAAPGDDNPGEAASSARQPPSTIKANDKLKGKELKRRIKDECDYINKTLALLHVPQHKKAGSAGSDGGEDDEDEDDDGVDDVPPEVKRAMKARLQMQMKQRAKNPTDLHARLQLKLAELRGSTTTGKGKKKDRKPKLTKAEKKAKVREAKRLQAKLKRASSVAESVGAKPAKPVYNNGGKMVFSKFDFGSKADLAAVDKGGPQQPGAARKGGSDPKAALAKIQKHKEMIKTLKTKGKTDEVREIEDKSAWKSALDKAEGVKVKDDEGLLKKSIKKMEQKKNRSKKKWEARVEAEDSRKKAKQQKRSDNISRRKVDKKAKKSKGRPIPGFR